MIIDKKLKTLMILLMVLSISFLFSATRDELTNGTSEEASSISNLKGLGTLGIVAQIGYGSNSADFIFDRISCTSYNMQPFTYDSEETEYNYSTYSAADSLKITFPASGDYRLEAKHYGSSTVTTFTQDMVNGIVYVPLKYAESSSGMDTSGNPSGDTQNNVLTIVADPDTKAETAYTLRFRRRAENLPATGAISNISGTVGSSFTCLVSGSNTTAQTTNGDNLSSLQEVAWSVNSVTGTAYFDENTLEGLSNGIVTVTATLVNENTISTISGNYTLSGFSNWNPHLGKLELIDKYSSTLNLSPEFSSAPSSDGIFYTSIVEDYSTITLNLMAPLDCQVFIDDARVSSNGSSTLRIGPTDPNNGPNAITYTIKVVNTQGSKTYILNIQREISERLRYGGEDEPHLASATGDVFGMNTANTNKFTVQAWARWTTVPDDGDSWANICSQTFSANGTSGSFWLQHNNQNSSFEFAFKPTGARVYVVSDPSKVTIQRGIWYLVTGVYNAGPVRIYVNDQDVTQSSRNTTGTLFADSNSEFNIGKMPKSTRLFSGNIRNVRIWVGEARTLSQIEDDYEDTPLAGSNDDDSDFSWPLNETSVGSVAQGNGDLLLTMTDVTSDDFVACCTNNRASGKALVHRPERMDFSSATSESVILVQADGYSGSNLRFRILGPQGVTGNEMEVWDHVSKTWKASGDISSGILMDSDLGNPATGTYFWVPVRRNTSTSGGGRYVDDDTETNYDGADTDAGTRTWYNTIMPLPSIIAMSSPFTLTGTLSGDEDYPLSEKYVILGYDAVEKGKLITGTSSSQVAKDGKALGSYTLVSDTPLHRIEVRTQDDILVTYKNNESGWDAEEEIGDITLPVELSSFTVSAITSGARLQWVSQSESGLMGYYVYRAETEDLASATLVSPVIEASNLTQTHVYSYTDVDLLTQTEYYYWLMVSEYSGVFSMYGPITIILSEEGDSIEIPFITGLDKLYPNPFNPELNIRYSLKETADMNLNIYNLKGQKVHSKELLSQAKGYHQYTWDASDNSSGIYFVVFKSGKTEEVRKVILNK